MSGTETTPRKQTNLEWSFSKSTEEGEKEELEVDTKIEQWATSTPSPFKNLRSNSSPEQWKAFNEELEAARLQNIADAQASYHF